ncbi:MAG: hypothetical protein K0V04_32610 [Deltaproteobacteria bacterium]|nr:hypothetical protein [Deltaproteobacteria bacterium]
MSDPVRLSDPPSLVELPVELGPITGPRTGWLVGFDVHDRPQIDYPGNPVGPLRARTTVVIDPSERAQLSASRPAVVLLFEDGDPGRPIVVGLLHDRAVQPEAPATTAPPPAAQMRCVEIEADQELVLRCGKASITLRRDGRVHVRGTYVETRSKGVNRIKGGSVQIN